MLVFSKPSGLLSVPGKDAHLADCMEGRARAIYPDALLVHRLDMETSGIFLMARGKEVQANLGKQFECRKVQKTYIARVAGHPENDSGLIDLPLRCDWPNRPRQMVCYEHGKPSQTRWEVLEREAAGFSRLALYPITGRSHQLRVHLAEIGHAILGDPFYASETMRNAADRLQLHAQSLTIHHPDGGALITFTDPAPF
ncbi:MAG: pseudouridine synthase [Alphaproteobacteria bacterium]